MSTDLFWQPFCPPKGKSLPLALKYALSPTIFGHDGSLSSSPELMDKTRLDYVQGLCDARVSGAAELMDAIRKYGTVEVWVE